MRQQWCPGRFSSPPQKRPGNEARYSYAELWPAGHTHRNPRACAPRDNNIILAKKFNCTMRYIDDLLALNNSSFACKTSDIYPRELILKKTTD